MCQECHKECQDGGTDGLYNLFHFPGNAGRAFVNHYPRRYVSEAAIHRLFDIKCQGRSQDLVSGGHPFRGGGRPPYFSPQTPNNKSPPLCTFGYPRISGGPGPPPRLATPFANAIEFEDAVELMFDLSAPFAQQQWEDVVPKSRLQGGKGPASLQVGLSKSHPFALENGSRSQVRGVYLTQGIADCQRLCQSFNQPG